MDFLTVRKSGGFFSPGLFVFFVSFALLLFFSVSPSVYTGDTGLISAASFLLGSAHPPGYPLFVLLGKLFTFLPLGNIAFKVNLLAAFCGAGAALIAYEAAFYLTGNFLVSLLAPLITLGAPNFALQCSMAKGGIYTLNSCLVLLVFYLGLKSVKEENPHKYIMLSSFVLGIGMACHQTMGFMLFAIIYVIIVRRRALPFGTVAASVLLVTAGLTVYLYLYLRTMAGGEVVYSHVRSLESFFFVFFRKGYSASTIDALKATSSGWAGWLYGVRNVISLMSFAFSPLMWLFVVAGIFGTLRDRKTFGYLLITLGVWFILGKITVPQKTLDQGSIDIVIPYFSHLVPILATVAAAGLFRCAQAIRSRSSVVSTSLACGIIVFQSVYVPIGLQKSSLTGNFVAYQWMWDISKVLKPKSFYLAFGDNADFLSYYGLGVERMRDDVLCLTTIPGDNSFSLTIAPPWKYARLYPEFYEGINTSVKYFYPLAKEGRLFASTSASLPTVIKDKFDVRPFVLSTMLLPRDGKAPPEKMFREAFKRIDYLPIVPWMHGDAFAREARDNYLLTIYNYTNMLAREDSKDTDFYYRLCIFLSPAEKKYFLIEKYVRFLSEKRGKEAALAFLAQLEGKASNRVISRLQDIALSPGQTRSEAESSKVNARQQ